MSLPGNQQRVRLAAIDNESGLLPLDEALSEPDPLAMARTSELLAEVATAMGMAYDLGFGTFATIQGDEEVPH